MSLNEKRFCVSVCVKRVHSHPVYWKIIIADFPTAKR